MRGPAAVGDGSRIIGASTIVADVGIRRADGDGRDLDPEEDEVYAESSTFAGFAPPGTVRRTAPAPITAWYSLEQRGSRGALDAPARIRAVAVGFAHVVAADDLGRVFTGKARTPARTRRAWTLLRDARADGAGLA